MNIVTVIGIQNPIGRIHSHVRAFGLIDLPGTPLVEVALDPVDAYDITLAASRNEPVTIEVEPNSWIYCANIGGISITPLKSA